MNKAKSLDNYKLSCELTGHKLDVRAVSPATDDDILSGSRDKSVKIWKKVGEIYVEGVTLTDHTNFVSCIYYMEREGLIFTGSNDSTICVYKEDSYVPVLILKGHESTVCSINKGIEPMSIISGSWDNSARVWLLGTEGLRNTIVLKGHEAAVWAVDSTADGRFVTGSADKTIAYWNAKGERLKVLTGHTDCVRGVIALENGILVSCSNDAVIRCWNSDGDCVKELFGHTNYIYSISRMKDSGSDTIVSCGEDGSVRMWSLSADQEIGSPLLLPSQSVWSVACLKNGDIVTGSSDGVVRVFTRDPSRYADPVALSVFEATVAARVQQVNDQIGTIKKSDLPGEEALLKNGKREGQTTMINHSDGTVKCYVWKNGKWDLIGDVTGGVGAGPEKRVYEGKEYDFVFSVDISDNMPPLKLPYNKGDDPWTAAQTFIDKHNLPQVYLEQVANFIVKNSKDNAPPMSQTAVSGYQDPFTGGSRYVPGSGGNDRPTGLTSAQVDFGKKHFPVKVFVTIDKCDPSKVLEKLKEFNRKQFEGSGVSDNLLETVVQLTDDEPLLNAVAIDALHHLLRWPSEILFPVLDVTRLAVRNEPIFNYMESIKILDIILTHLETSPPNQLMASRCIANMMNHSSGRKQVDSRLKFIIESITKIKSGNSNLQIAIATFYLNCTTSAVLGSSTSDVSSCVTEGLIEFLKWATDLEACYRSIQSFGNLMTSPFAQTISAQVISADHIVDKVRNFSETPQAVGFEKITEAAKELLSALSAS